MRLDIDRSNDYRRGGGGLATKVKHKRQDANKWDERVGECHVKSAGYEKNER